MTIGRSDTEWNGDEDVIDLLVDAGISNDDWRALVADETAQSLNTKDAHGTMTSIEAAATGLAPGVLTVTRVVEADGSSSGTRRLSEAPLAIEGIVPLTIEPNIYPSSYAFTVEGVQGLQEPAIVTRVYNLDEDLDPDYVNLTALDPAIVDSLVPELWLTNGSGGWVKARDTCDPEKVYWTTNRETNQYEVSVCDFNPGNGSLSEARFFFQAAPVARAHLLSPIGWGAVHNASGGGYAQSDGANSTASFAAAAADAAANGQGYKLYSTTISLPIELKLNGSASYAVALADAPAGAHAHINTHLYAAVAPAQVRPRQRHDCHVHLGDAAEPRRIREAQCHARREYLP